jgi:hypothetical protein
MNAAGASSGARPGCPYGTAMGELGKDPRRRAFLVHQLVYCVVYRTTQIAH